MSNSSIWPIDRTSLGVTTPGQSQPGRNGDEEVLHIPQSSAYWNHTIRLFVISRTRVGEVLPLCRDATGVSYSPAD